MQDDSVQQMELILSWNLLRFTVRSKRQSKTKNGACKRSSYPPLVVLTKDTFQNLFIVISMWIYDHM
jgi:hypothetical protein